MVNRVVSQSKSILPSMSWPQFRMALARTDRNPTIALVGSSIIHGQNSGTGQAANSPAVKLAQWFQARGINAGSDGMFGSAGYWGSGTATIAQYNTGDTIISASSGSAAFSGTVAPAQNAMGLNSATGSWSWTSRFPCTKARVRLRDFSTGRNFDWTADAGSPNRVNSSNTGIATYDWALGALGIHTLKIDWAAGGVDVLGVFFYDDTAGRRQIDIYDWGWSGAKSADFIAAGSPYARHAMPSKFSVDLALAELGLPNDWRQSTALATVQANMLTWCQQQEMDKVNYGLLAPPFDAGVAGATAQQEDYIGVMRDMASARGVPFLNPRELMVDFATANAGGLYFDSTIHQTQSPGNTFLADFLGRAITR